MEHVCYTPESAALSYTVLGDANNDKHLNNMDTCHCLFALLVFNNTFSTNRLYRVIGV